MKPSLEGCTPNMLGYEMRCVEFMEHLHAIRNHYIQKQIVTYVTLVKFRKEFLPLTLNQDDIAPLT